MNLRIFSFLCFAVSMLGIVPVLFNSSVHDHVALILFGVAMIFMGLGFTFVSRALSNMSAHK
jgi:hypothetical protein